MKFIILLILIMPGSIVLGQCTFTNPIKVGESPDPWVTYKDGLYYGCYTTLSDVIIRKSDRLENVFNEDSAKVWEGQENIWAPELHYLNGKWYIYTCYNTNTMVVLEGTSQDPLQPFVEKSNITYNTGFGIDQTIWRDPITNQLYLAYSKHETRGQEIWIIKMSNPYTTAGEPVALSYPQYDWEKEYGSVNEGPQFLVHGNKVHIIYSASQCHFEGYKLGQLTATIGTDLLDTNQWTKSTVPVFQSSVENDVYAVGHHSCVETPNGEWWIIYHGKDGENKNVQYAPRDARMQQFTWNGDYPDFGIPVSYDTELNCPGEGALTGCSDIQTPYLENSVPGIIEFEHFDNGCPDEAWYDLDTSNNGKQYRTDEGVDIESCSEGGYNIGWCETGEWMEYTINVSSSDEYLMGLRLASATDDNRFHIEIDGADQTGSITLNTIGGLQDWSTHYYNINLTAGEHILRFVIDNGTGGLNLNYMTFSVATGMKDMQSDEIFIWPNPVQSELKIKHEQLTIDAIIIADLQGKVVLNNLQKISLEGGQTKDHVLIDISSLSSGEYFIAIRTKKETITKKFIKQ